jgi:hypothetical protein
MKQIKYILCFFAAFLLLNYAGGKILLTGIERFYGLNQQANVLLIGHSHLMLAVDKDELEEGTGMKVSKYTREGVNVYDRYFMLKQFLDSPYSDSLKIVLYGVDMYSFVASGLSENSYTLFYPFMDEPVMNQYIKENARDKKDYWVHKLLPLERYSDVLINASIRGWRNDYSNYKLGTIDMEKYKKQLSSDQQFNRTIETDESLYRMFDKTIGMVTSKGIQVVLVNTPIIDLLNHTDDESYEKIISLYKEYANSNKMVEYIDFNPGYSSDYSIFYDPIHLNPKGQELLTEELIKKLAKTHD